MRVGWPGWSVEVSDAWVVTDHPECLTLELSSEGALQLSSARKKEGSVDPEELFFSEEQREGWGAWKPATCGDFVGIVYEYTLDGSVWNRWFLRSGPMLVFVTYNATPQAAEQQEAAVVGVLNTLLAESETEA